MKVFDYEDVQLIPNKCIVNSRSECDTTVILGKHAFKMPIVPANMQTIINEPISEFLAENGYFYIMHRFNGSARIPFVKKMKERQWISSISVGVKKEEYLLIEELAKQGLTPDYITIDIAHGHSNSVIEMIQRIKTHLPETFVIAGNVGTPEAVRELENAGADATKVGIGPGKVCITKIKTGFGATMVMIGSLFAGHEESSGETKIENGIAYKEYFGSASEFQKGERKNVEGKKIWIQHKGSLKDTLIEMHQDLQSSISYAGGRDLEAIRKVDYVIVKNSIFNGDTI
ncbi:GMP reductase [Helicobacter pylori]|uniref:GMP reductase n=1 Tax=Helicobacter pylori TaxID=210 RepID=UPI0015E65B4A|nr:GMP reductase [Helicobacter pylori]